MKKLTLSLLALALFAGSSISNVDARSCCPKKCETTCKKRNCGCNGWRCGSKRKYSNKQDKMHSKDKAKTEKR